jgi:diguanylate cyclase (GGDEF)-like protein/PAS domain S-box-containing protein
VATKSAASRSRYLHSQDLVALEWTDTPMWVFDLIEKRMRWANSAGLNYWNSDSLDEFLARDFSDLSESAIARNQVQMTLHASGLTGRDQWTVYPKGKPTTLNAHSIGIEMDDGTLAILYEATQVATPLDPSVLRGAEAMQQTPVIIALHRLCDGSAVMRNPAAVRHLGVADQAARANDFFMMFASPEKAWAALIDVRAGDVHTTEAELLTFQGIRWYRIEARPVLDPVTGESMLQLNGQDITERREVENSLYASEQRWKFAIEDAGDGLWDWNIQTGETYYSPRLKKMLQVADIELGNSASEWKKRIHPDDRQRVMNAMPPFIQGNTGNVEIEFRMQRDDGSLIWVMARCRVVERDINGKPLRVIGTTTDISARKAAKAALQESEGRLRTVVEYTREAIAVHQDGKVIFVNPATVQMMGASSAEELIDRPALEFLHPEFREIVKERWASHIVAGQAMPLIEEKFVRRDGVVIDVEVQGAPIQFMGKPAIQVAMRDITERKAAESKLRLAASVFNNARESLMITDAEGTIIDVNDAFCSITGYGRQEAIGRNPRFLSSGRQNSAFYEEMWNSLNSQGYWSGEVWNRRKCGEFYAEMLTISAVRDSAGKTKQYVGLASDITSLKTHQRQLEHIAHFDALTGLPNRVLFAIRLDQEMDNAIRYNKHLAIAFLDLDGFKGINDQYGHSTGDQMLVTLAQRMKSVLKEQDTLARLGGDEFVLVITDLDQVGTCAPLLTPLLVAASQPIHVGEHVLQVSASAGVTFFPQCGDVDADQLLRQADQAMYQAKVAGKNRFHLFDAEHDSTLRGHHASLERIRKALSADELILHYQPKVNMRTGAIVGAEALIRWQHPEKGLVSPAEFLPVIENDTLSIQIGEWVIAKALQQIQEWHLSGLRIAISVNVGAHHLQQNDFVDRLHDLIAKFPKVAPGYLNLEVLETSALEDIDKASAVIEACAAMGVTFALDDFGTGYSSLTYLKRLHVKQLKIDQSFVRDMLVDADDLAILKGVIGLAVAFKREVIAEGVESEAHGRLLMDLGCDLAQGYAISKPLPPESFSEWMLKWLDKPAWADCANASS